MLASSARERDGARRFQCYSVQSSRPALIGPGHASISRADGIAASTDCKPSQRVDKFEIEQGAGCDGRDRRPVISIIGASTPPAQPQKYAEASDSTSNNHWKGKTGGSWHRRWSLW